MNKVFNKKYFLPLLVFILLSVGTGAAFWLTQSSQDIRQQASCGCLSSDPYCTCDINGNEVEIDPDAGRVIVGEDSIEKHKGILASSYDGDRPETEGGCTGVWMNDFCYMPGDQLAGGKVVVDNGRYDHPYFENQQTADSVDFGAETTKPSKIGSSESLGDDCGGKGLAVNGICYAYGSTLNGYLVMPPRTGGCDNAAGDYCYAHLEQIDTEYAVWEDAVTKYEETGSLAALEKLYKDTYGINFAVGGLYNPDAANADVLRAEALLSSLTNAEVLQQQAASKNKDLQEKLDDPETSAADKELIQAQIDFNQGLIDDKYLATRYQSLDQLTAAAAKDTSFSVAINQLQNDYVNAADADLAKVTAARFKEIFGYDLSEKYDSFEGALRGIGIDVEVLNEHRKVEQQKIAEATAEVIPAMTQDQADKFNNSGLPRFVSGEIDKTTLLRLMGFDPRSEKYASLSEEDLLREIMTQFAMSEEESSTYITDVLNTRKLNLSLQDDALQEYLETGNIEILKKKAMEGMSLAQITGGGVSNDPKVLLKQIYGNDVGSEIFDSIKLPEAFTKEEVATLPTVRITGVITDEQQKTADLQDYAKTGKVEYLIRLGRNTEGIVEEALSRYGDGDLSRAQLLEITGVDGQGVSEEQFLTAIYKEFGVEETQAKERAAQLSNLHQINTSLKNQGATSLRESMEREYVAGKSIAALTSGGLPGVRELMQVKLGKDAGDQIYQEKFLPAYVDESIASYWQNPNDLEKICYEVLAQGCNFQLSQDAPSQLGEINAADTNAAKLAKLFEGVYGKNSGINVEQKAAQTALNLFESGRDYRAEKSKEAIALGALSGKTATDTILDSNSYGLASSSNFKIGVDSDLDKKYESSKQELRSAVELANNFNSQNNFTYAANARANGANIEDTTFMTAATTAILRDSLVGGVYKNNFLTGSNNLGLGYFEAKRLFYNQVGTQVFGVENIAENVATNYATARQQGYTGPANTDVANLIMQGVENLGENYADYSGALGFDYQAGNDMFYTKLGLINTKSGLAGAAASLANWDIKAGEQKKDEVLANTIERNAKKLAADYNIKPEDFVTFQTDDEVVRSRTELNWERAEKVIAKPAAIMAAPLALASGAGLMAGIAYTTSAFSVYQAAGQRARAYELERTYISSDQQLDNKNVAAQNLMAAADQSGEQLSYQEAVAEIDNQAHSLKYQSNMNLANAALQLLGGASGSFSSAGNVGVAQRLGTVSRYGGMGMAGLTGATAYGEIKNTNYQLAEIEQKLNSNTLTEAERDYYTQQRDQLKKQRKYSYATLGTSVLNIATSGFNGVKQSALSGNNASFTTAKNFSLADVTLDVLGLVGGTSMDVYNISQSCQGNTADGQACRDAWIGLALGVAQDAVALQQSYSEARSYQRQSADLTQKLGLVDQKIAQQVEVIRDKSNNDEAVVAAKKSLATLLPHRQELAEQTLAVGGKVGNLAAVLRGIETTEPINSNPTTKLGDLALGLSKNPSSTSTSDDPLPLSSTAKLTAGADQIEEVIRTASAEKNELNLNEAQRQTLEQLATDLKQLPILEGDIQRLEDEILVIKLSGSEHEKQSSQLASKIAGLESVQERIRNATADLTGDNNGPSVAGAVKLSAEQVDFLKTIGSSGKSNGLDLGELAVVAGGIKAVDPVMDEVLKIASGVGGAGEAGRASNVGEVGVDETSQPKLAQGDGENDDGGGGKEALVERQPKSEAAAAEKSEGGITGFFKKQWQEKVTQPFADWQARRVANTELERISKNRSVVAEQFVGAKDAFSDLNKIQADIKKIDADIDKISQQIAKTQGDAPLIAIRKNARATKKAVIDSVAEQNKALKSIQDARKELVSRVETLEGSLLKPILGDDFSQKITDDFAPEIEGIQKQVKLEIDGLDLNKPQKNMVEDLLEIKAKIFDPNQVDNIVKNRQEYNQKLTDLSKSVLGESPELADYQKLNTAQSVLKKSSVLDAAMSAVKNGKSPAEIRSTLASKEVDSGSMISDDPLVAARFDNILREVELRSGVAENRELFSTRVNQMDTLLKFLTGDNTAVELTTSGGKTFVGAILLKADLELFGYETGVYMAKLGQESDVKRSLQRALGLGDSDVVLLDSTKLGDKNYVAELLASKIVVTNSSAPKFIRNSVNNFDDPNKSTAKKVYKKITNRISLYADEPQLTLDPKQQAINSVGKSTDPIKKELGELGRRVGDAFKDTLLSKGGWGEGEHSFLETETKRGAAAAYLTVEGYETIFKNLAQKIDGIDESTYVKIASNADDLEKLSQGDPNVYNQKLQELGIEISAEDMTRIFEEIDMVNNFAQGLRMRADTDYKRQIDEVLKKQNGLNRPVTVPADNAKASEGRSYSAGLQVALEYIGARAYGQEPKFEGLTSSPPKAFKSSMPDYFGDLVDSRKSAATGFLAEAAGVVQVTMGMNAHRSTEAVEKVLSEEGSSTGGRINVDRTYQINKANLVDAIVALKKTGKLDKSFGLDSQGNLKIAAGYDGDKEALVKEIALSGAFDEDITKYTYQKADGDYALVRFKNGEMEIIKDVVTTSDIQDMYKNGETNLVSLIGKNGSTGDSIDTAENISTLTITRYDYPEGIIAQTGARADRGDGISEQYAIVIRNDVEKVDAVKPEKLLADTKMNETDFQGFRENVTQVQIKAEKSTTTEAANITLSTASNRSLSKLMMESENNKLTEWASAKLLEFGENTQKLNLKLTVDDEKTLASRQENINAQHELWKRLAANPENSEFLKIISEENPDIFEKIMRENVGVDPEDFLRDIGKRNPETLKNLIENANVEIRLAYATQASETRESLAASQSLAGYAAVHNKVMTADSESEYVASSGRTPKADQIATGDQSGTPDGVKAAGEISETIETAKDFQGTAIDMSNFLNLPDVIRVLRSFDYPRIGLQISSFTANIRKERTDKVDTYRTVLSNIQDLRAKRASLDREADKVRIGELSEKIVDLEDYVRNDVSLQIKAAKVINDATGGVIGWARNTLPTYQASSTERNRQQKLLEDNNKQIASLQEDLAADAVDGKLTGDEVGEIKAEITRLEKEIKDQVPWRMRVGADLFGNNAGKEEADAPSALPVANLDREIADKGGYFRLGELDNTLLGFDLPLLQNHTLTEDEPSGSYTLNFIGNPSEEVASINGSKIELGGSDPLQVGDEISFPAENGETLTFVYKGTATTEDNGATVIYPVLVRKLAEQIEDENSTPEQEKTQPTTEEKNSKGGAVMVAAKNWVVGWLNKTPFFNIKTEESARGEELEEDQGGEFRIKVGGEEALPFEKTDWDSMYYSFTELADQVNAAREYEQKQILVDEYNQKVRNTPVFSQINDFDKAFIEIEDQDSELLQELLIDKREYPDQLVFLTNEGNLYRIIGRNDSTNDLGSDILGKDYVRLVEDQLSNRWIAKATALDQSDESLGFRGKDQVAKEKLAHLLFAEFDIYSPKIKLELTASNEAIYFSEYIERTKNNQDRYFDYPLIHILNLWMRNNDPQYLESESQIYPFDNEFLLQSLFMKGESGFVANKKFDFPEEISLDHFSSAITEVKKYVNDEKNLRDLVRQAGFTSIDEDLIIAYLQQTASTLEADIQAWIDGELIRSEAQFLKENDVGAKKDEEALANTNNTELWRVGYGDYSNNWIINYNYLDRLSEKEVDQLNLESFLTDSIKKLLESATSDKPAIIMDFGATQGHTLVRLARDFSNEIENNRLILIASNLTHLPDEKLESEFMDGYYGSSIADMNNEAVPDYYEYAKKVVWVNGKAADLENMTIEDVNGRPISLKDNVDIINENFVLQHVRKDEEVGVTPEEREEKAVSSLKNMLKEDGLIISHDLNPDLESDSKYNKYLAQKLIVNGSGDDLIKDFLLDNTQDKLVKKDNGERNAAEQEKNSKGGAVMVAAKNWVVGWLNKTPFFNIKTEESARGEEDQGGEFRIKVGGEEAKYLERFKVSRTQQPAEEDSGSVRLDESDESIETFEEIHEEGFTVENISAEDRQAFNAWIKSDELEKDIERAITIYAKGFWENSNLHKLLGIIVGIAQQNVDEFLENKTWQEMGSDWSLDQVITIDGEQWFLPRKMSESSGNDVVVLFKKDGDKFIPRIFIKSTSGGMWRGVPGYEGGYVHKGAIDEYYHYSQTAQLHPRLNKFFAENISSFKKTPSARYEVLFDPYFQRNIGWYTYDKEINHLKYKGIEGVIKYSPGSLTKESYGTISANEMENVSFPKGFIPDFTQDPELIYQEEHELLGQVQYELFSGATFRGRPIKWLMARNKEGKCWAQNIFFADESLSSYGTFANVLDAGILTSKPVDYGKNVTAIEDQYKIEKGKADYVDVTSFLIHLRPIREYADSRKNLDFDLEIENPPSGASPALVGFRLAGERAETSSTQKLDSAVAGSQNKTKTIVPVIESLEITKIDGGIESTYLGSFAVQPFIRAYAKYLPPEDYPQFWEKDGRGKLIPYAGLRPHAFLWELGKNVVRKWWKNISDPSMGFIPASIRELVQGDLSVLESKVSSVAQQLGLENIQPALTTHGLNSQLTLLKSYPQKLQLQNNALILHQQLNAGQEHTFGRRNFGAEFSRFTTVLGQEEQISRDHFKLKFEQGNVYIQDPDSTNGVYINGKRIKSTTTSSAAEEWVAISATDVVSLGDRVVNFKIHSNADGSIQLLNMSTVNNESLVKEKYTAELNKIAFVDLIFRLISEKIILNPKRSIMVNGETVSSPELKNGDLVTFTDMKGVRYTYVVTMFGEKISLKDLHSRESNDRGSIVSLVENVTISISKQDHTNLIRSALAASLQLKVNNKQLENNKGEYLHPGDKVSLVIDGQTRTWNLEINEAGIMELVETTPTADTTAVDVEESNGLVDEVDKLSVPQGTAPAPTTVVGFTSEEIAKFVQQYAANLPAAKTGKVFITGQVDIPQSFGLDLQRIPLLEELVGGLLLDLQSALLARQQQILNLRRQVANLLTTVQISQNISSHEKFADLYSQTWTKLTAAGITSFEEITSYEELVGRLSSEEFITSFQLLDTDQQSAVIGAVQQLADGIPVNGKNIGKILDAKQAEEDLNKAKQEAIAGEVRRIGRLVDEVRENLLNNWQQLDLDNLLDPQGKGLSVANKTIIQKKVKEKVDQEYNINSEEGQYQPLAEEVIKDFVVKFANKIRDDLRPSQHKRFDLLSFVDKEEVKKIRSAEFSKSQKVKTAQILDAPDISNWSQKTTPGKDPMVIIRQGIGVFAKKLIYKQDSSNEQPIELIHVGNGVYVAIEGTHRIAAAKFAGTEELDAVVKELELPPGQTLIKFLEEKSLANVSQRQELLDAYNWVATLENSEAVEENTGEFSYEFPDDSVLGKYLNELSRDIKSGKSPLILVHPTILKETFDRINKILENPDISLNEKLSQIKNKLGEVKSNLRAVDKPDVVGIVSEELKSPQYQTKTYGQYREELISNIKAKLNSYLTTLGYHPQNYLQRLADDKGLYTVDKLVESLVIGSQDSQAVAYADQQTAALVDRTSIRDDGTYVAEEASPIILSDDLLRIVSRDPGVGDNNFQNIKYLFNNWFLKNGFNDQEAMTQFTADAGVNADLMIRQIVFGADEGIGSREDRKRYVGIYIDELSVFQAKIQKNLQTTQTLRKVSPLINNHFSDLFGGVEAATVNTIIEIEVDFISSQLDGVKTQADQVAPTTTPPQVLGESAFDNTCSSCSEVCEDVSEGVDAADKLSN